MLIFGRQRAWHGYSAKDKIIFEPFIIQQENLYSTGMSLLTFLHPTNP